MHLDFYQGSTAAKPNTLIDAMMAVEGMHSVEHFQHGLGAGYRKHSIVRDTIGDTGAIIMFDSHNANPSIKASGHHAPAFAAMLRRDFPVHNVSRVDVAEDMTGQGTFEKVHAVLRAVAEKHKRDGTGLEMSPWNPEKGRTCYVGSTQSPSRIRLYEKGLEMVAKGRAKLEDVDQTLTRLEHQYRPKKPEAKAAAATMTPEAFMGVSAFCRDLTQEVLGLDVPRSFHARREIGDWDKTDQYLIEAFNRHIHEGGSRKATLEWGMDMPLIDDALDAWWDHAKPRLKQAILDRLNRNRF